MPKKAYAKKKAYKLKIRSQVKAGFINDADGKWYQPKGNDNMARDQYNGYRFSR